MLDSSLIHTIVFVAAGIDATPTYRASSRRSELRGYPEFDPQKILSDLDLYLVGGYPAMAQMVTLRKPVV